MVVMILCGVTIGLFAIGLIIAAVNYLWRFRLASPLTGRDLDRFIAATICCMPLLMPYYMDYDLLLLAIPAVLVAMEWIGTGQSGRGLDRLLLWAWAALFLVLYVNPGLSGATRLNLAAPLVALVAALMILRSIRVDCSDQVAVRSEERPVALAA
jgi:hypothetical protein